MSDLHVHPGRNFSGHMPPAPGAITTLLIRVNGGDRDAFGDLVPLVYQELRRIAQAYLRREAQNHTLQPTSLIHEAYLRMVDNGIDYECRQHFFGIAARVMRQILVDHARARQAAKRGAAVTVALDPGMDMAPDRNRALIRLDDALKSLAKEDERKARLVEMRFFGGMSAEDIARCVGMPVHAVRRELRSAKIRLRQEIEG
jgi:RNA polymerase sigma-70 factor (ECF subfamily)